MARKLADRNTPPASSASGTVLEVGPHFAVASWRNVFVVVWRNETLAEDARKVQKHLETFRRWHSTGIFLLTIVYENAPPPPRDARQAIARYLDDGKDDIAAAAVIMDGDSWRAAFVRGVATSLTLIARQPFPFRVCSMQEAVKLFETHGQQQGIRFNAAALPRAIHDLRQQIESDPIAQSTTQPRRS